MEKIPVNIISGFLGSGKTTAILQLLAQKTDEEQWAVVINEFGKISIDSQTIRSSSHSGTVYDISGGCICCSARGYLYENLSKIVQTGNYSRIIIEPSGLGGIDTVSEMVGLIPELSLIQVICMVDITTLENHRIQFSPVYRAQIIKSDIIIFSKCDLVFDGKEKERLIEIFKTTFPDKQNFQTISIILSSLVSVNFRDKQEINKYQMLFGANPDLISDNYLEKNFKFNHETIFDTDKLCRFFTENPFIVRGKGHVRTNGGWQLANFTPSGYTFEPCQEKEQSEFVIIADKSGVDLTKNLKVGIESAVISVNT